jgi:hypothetical protein
MKVVKVLEAIDLISALAGEPQYWRVVILQRDDGHFTFAEEYFYTRDDEGKFTTSGWARLYPQGIFASAEIAEVEGRSFFLQKHKVGR